MWDGAGLTPNKMVDEIVFKHNILCAIAAGNSFANLIKVLVVRMVL